jgi:hypothetical protein
MLLFCSCTYFDYNESVQYTGWGRQGGQVGSPFSVRWSPFSGSISDGSDYGCGYGYGDSDYSYRNASFHAPNFSVTMTETTYNGETHESNDVWHPGRGSYYYNGYLYSGSAPGSHIPSGSAPSSPSSYGSIIVAGIPLNYNGNPNFTNYAYIDPEAILDEKCPMPEIPVIPSPSIPSIDDDACFVAGTLVLMADSSMKRIEQIEVGDFVLARNDKLPNSSAVPRRINEIKHNPPSVTYHLKFRANSGDKEIYLRVTPEHPFYVENRGWVAVENLNINDICITNNKNKLKLLSKIFDSELIPVYNLEVDIDHTYFVGDDPENCLLVHNQYDPPSLQNADTIFDRKIFPTINGKENLEDSLVWTKRIFDIYVKG